MMTPEQIDSICCKLDVGLIGLLWCKGDLEDKANFLFNLVRHPPKRDANGTYIDARKHPNEFFKDLFESEKPPAGADLEQNGSPEPKAKEEPKPDQASQQPTHGFFASLFGGFSGHTALIEEIELPDASALAAAASAQAPTAAI